MNLSWIWPIKTLLLILNTTRIWKEIWGNYWNLFSATLKTIYSKSIRMIEIDWMVLDSKLNLNYLKFKIIFSQISLNMSDFLTISQKFLVYFSQKNRPIYVSNIQFSRTSNMCSLSGIMALGKGAGLLNSPLWI